MAETSESERARHRHRGIGLTAAASLGFRAAVMLSGFVYIPLTLHYLGPERYGIWVAMVSLMTLLSFADCGIGYGLMNHVAAAPDSAEDNRRAISTTFLVLCGVAVAGVALFFAAFPFLRWQSETARTVAVIVVCFFVTLPFTTVQRVQSAFQAGFENQLWEIAGVALSLGALLVAIRFRASLPVLAIVFSLGPLLALALNWLLYFYVRHPEIAPHPRLAELPLARAIVREGVWFFILQLASVLIFSSDSFIILHFQGATALGQFSLAAKLFQALPALAAVFFAPLWPAYAEALARGDHGWVRTTLFRSTALGVGATTTAAVALALLIRPAIQVWTGASLHPSAALIGGLALYTVIVVGTSSVAAFLNGAGFIAGQAKLVIAHTALSVALKVLLCRYWDLAGVVWATNLGYLAIIVPAYFRLVPRLLGASVPHRFSNLLRFALPALFVAACARPRGRAAETPPRILVTRLDQIGDFIFTTAFLRELRRNFPASHITLLVRGNTAPLAERCPYADRVLVLESSPVRRDFRRDFRGYAQYLWSLGRYLASLPRFARAHLTGRIDLALQPRWDGDWEWATLLTFLSGAPRRVGFTEKTSAEKRWVNAGADLLLTDALAAGPDRHECERALELIRHMGGAVEDGAAELWLAGVEAVPVSGPAVAFGIGASHPKRHWPHFAELIGLLRREMRFTPVLIAGPGEEALVRGIADAVPDAIVLQNLRLDTVAATLAQCELFIGNDSGPLHVAAATGIPVVELSCHPEGAPAGHPNSPDRMGPITTRRAILRPPPASPDCARGCVADEAHCIAGIMPEAAARAAVGLLTREEALCASR